MKKKKNNAIFENKLEFSKKLMTKGISKKEVAELTGLTLEQIDNL